MFERERVYRRRDIHSEHGGQQQGGVATPSGKPYILVFTGGGDSYGYEDGWTEDGVFLYGGEGQLGDMEFRGGNKALRDHIADGKDLHLFKQLGRGEVRYMGCFLCASWEHQLTKDRAGNLRRSIIFQLVPIEGASTATVPPGMPLPATEENLRVLRLQALEAASEKPSMRPREAKKHLYRRSETVRSYVLARAGGVCEACGRPAPFSRTDGSPYLETHHTSRESDFGPDHPRSIGGICPSCHREVHFGAGGKELNRRLQDRLAKIEGSD